MIDNSLGFYLTLWMKCFFIVEVKLLHEMDRCASNDIIFAKIDMEQHQLSNATYEWTIGNFCPTSTSITFSSSWHGIPEWIPVRRTRQVAIDRNQERQPNLCRRISGVYFSGALYSTPHHHNNFDEALCTTGSMNIWNVRVWFTVTDIYIYILKRHGIESKYKS